MRFEFMNSSKLLKPLISSSILVTYTEPFVRRKISPFSNAVLELETGSQNVTYIISKLN